MIIDQKSELSSLSHIWKVVHVRDIFDIQQGKQVSKKNRVGNNQQPFLRTKNILWGRIDFSELDKMHFTEAEENRLSLQNGDLLLCEGGDVGRSAIWRDEMSRCYYQNHLHRLRVLNGEFDPEFALYWFWYAFEVGTVYFGRKNVTTIPNMSKSRLGGLPIPKPSIKDQRKIAAVLSLVQEAIFQQEKLIALTTELKKALMKKLFTQGTRGEKQKQTEIGPIPESWEMVNLGSKEPKIIEIMRNGYTGKQTTEVNEYKVTRIETIGDGFINPSRVRYALNPSAEVIEKYRIKKGDILFSHINSDQHLGKTGISNKDFNIMIHGMNLLLIRVNHSILNPWFLNYIFQWYRERGIFISICSRAINQSSINQGKMKSLPIPFPELNIQKSIAGILLNAEEKIDIYKKKLYSLQDIFRTLLHQLMTAKIRVNDLELSKLGLGLEKSEESGG